MNATSWLVLLACAPLALALTSACGSSDSGATAGSDSGAGDAVDGAPTGADASAADGGPGADGAPGVVDGGVDGAALDGGEVDGASGADGAACAARTIACGGACVDPATDDANCGGCAAPCGAGTGCFAGKCTTPAAPTDTSFRVHLGAALGPDGKAYFVGGTNNATVMAFDPATNTWSAPASMTTPRNEVAAATGKDGLIYALGYGLGGSPVTNEAYGAANNAWTTKTAAPIPAPPAWGSPSAAVGGDGRVYLADLYGASQTARLDAYDVASGAWTARQAPPVDAPSLAGGNDGRLYATGGLVSLQPANALEIYDPSTNAWAAGANLGTARDGHVATTLQDGRIFVAGGQAPGGYTASSEVYDPKTNTWVALPDAPATLSNAGGTTGRDGRVYITGGYVNGQQLHRLFVYSPTTNRWVASP